jgi:outer membrane protein assembly factor BamA
VTYDEPNTKATMHFKILEGPKVTVASIVIEGNDFTQDYVIKKELEFKVGDTLTPSKTEESIARLQRTGFFGSVDIRTVEVKSESAARTVLVKVTERDPGIFTIGGGATNERTLTLRGYTGVAYRNLLGTGRGVSLRLQGNYNVTDIRYLESRVVVGYLEPYLFDTRVRGRLNMTRSATVTDYDKKKVSQVNSATVSVEQDFTSHILGIWDVWGLATIRDYGLDPTIYPLDTTQDIATTGPTLDLDFRDNPFNPTKGTFTRWSAEYSAPWLGSSETETSSIEYWRTTLSFTHYLNVARWQRQPVVWANQVRGGYLKNLSPYAQGVPWDKKGFTLGGQSTIRGFEAGTQDVFPNDKDLGISSLAQTYFLSTDSTMYLIKSELRFPVYGNLGGAVFYDGGSVEIQGLEFPDHYRDAAGFGIRYATPVGPVSLEMAWKLDMRPGESPWRIHLSIGAF